MSGHDCSKLEKREHFHWWGEGYLPLKIQPLDAATTDTHTRTHILYLSLQSFLSLVFFSSLLRLFIVLHLPGLFECINQSSHSATAITHLVRIKEREGGREGITETGKQWRSETETRSGTERRGRAGGKGRKWRSALRKWHRVHSSFNIYPYLKTFHLLTIRSIHPSTHSASNQPCIHSFTYLWLMLPHPPT